MPWTPDSGGLATESTPLEEPGLFDLREQLGGDPGVESRRRRRADHLGHAEHEQGLCVPGRVPPHLPHVHFHAVTLAAAPV